MTTKTVDPTPTPMGLVLEAAESIPVNLESLARQLGIRLVRTPLDDSICGCIERTADGWRLIVNAEHSRSRQRFTIAHELGHFVLHATALGDGTNDTRKYRATPAARAYNHTLDARHEREANQFAASLLMPAAKVRQFQQVMQANDPGHLAELFQVSRGAMEIRLEELGEAERMPSDVPEPASANPFFPPHS